MSVKAYPNRFPAAMRLFLMVLLVLAGAACSRSPDSDESPQPPPKGFSFLGLHADSTLTESARERLTDQLGSVATENRVPLDLEMHHNGFLKTHFPDLDKLNRRLNFETGLKVRVEHAAYKLIYRYSDSFGYVALFFSSDSQKPLLFRIRAKTDGSGIAETFRKKYGAPETVVWSHAPGRSLVWRQDRDVLIISLFADRTGKPHYEIMICHVANIETMLEREKKETRKREKAPPQGAQSIF